MSATRMSFLMLAWLALATASHVHARAHEGHDHATPKGSDAASAESTSAAGPAALGEALPQLDATPLAIALAEADPTTGNRLVSGRIGKVCQNKGCWMTLHDGETMVRVETGHRFAIPADAQGVAVVYGSLRKTMLDENRAGHLRSESLDVAAGESWTIDAVGVRIGE